jgi:SAM-dependent methyltransferase
MRESIFEREAQRYDAWYDTPAGQAILAAELGAVRPLFGGLPHPWLEVGVGGGRFAAALGVEAGVDPALGALRLAARRGVSVAAARGEQLPFRGGAFGAVLFALALCFVPDQLAALREARRVLRPAGGVVVGDLPADGPWGRHYLAQAAAGHPYYRDARFLTRAELLALLLEAGLRPVRRRSALFRPPAAAPSDEAAREGDDPRAGFLALLAVPDR